MAEVANRRSNDWNKKRKQGKKETTKEKERKLSVLLTIDDDVILAHSSNVFSQEVSVIRRLDHLILQRNKAKVVLRQLLANHILQVREFKMNSPPKITHTKSKTNHKIRQSVITIQQTIP
jgi:hypothetical protein